MFPHHFGCGWSWAIAPPTSSCFQQRLRERSHTAARAGFCFGELPQERLRLSGPPPAHFASEDHELCQPKSTSQLGIRSLFSSSGDGEGCSILPGTTWTWQNVASHRRHQCGVNGQLCSVNNGRPSATTSSRRLSGRP